MKRVKVADLHLGDEVNHNGTWCRLVRIFTIPTAKGSPRRGLRLREIDGDHDTREIALSVDHWVDVRS